MFMVQLLLFADTALQKIKIKNNLLQNIHGHKIKQGAYQHRFRALTPFSVFRNPTLDMFLQFIGC